MKLLRLYLTIAFCTSISCPSFAQLSQPAVSLAPLISSVETSEKEALIGRDLIFNRRYDEALTHFKNIAQKDPESPLGTFGQMAVWQARMFENDDFRFDAEYSAVSDLNKKIVERILKNKEASAWDLFLSAASSGLRGFYLMRKEAPLKALGEANKAQKAALLGLKKDPSFSDANLGLGMYDYWRSVFTNRIKILPFFKDKRKEGLALVERAAKENRFLGALADMSLAFCHYEAGNASAGLPWVEKVLKTYPENVLAQTLWIQFQIKNRQYAKAQAKLDELIQKYPDLTQPIFLKGYAYDWEGKKLDAKKFYETFMQKKPQGWNASFAMLRLGEMDLEAGKRKEAFEKFKKSYDLHSNSDALHQIQKMREQN